MKPSVQLTLLIAAALAAAGLASEPTAATPGRTFATVTRTNTAGLRPFSDRAFFGAPPVIVHRGILNSERATDCLQCHAKENRVALRQQAISPLPHAEFSQCTQCHVRAAPEVAPFRQGNTFTGLDLPGKGSRAHPLAPPTIPHKTFMRDNCLSCHGPTGQWRIKTPHPFRTQCRQCHAAEADQDHTRP